MKDILAANAGKKISEECKKRSVKQRDFAEALEVSPSSVSSFFNGKRTLPLSKIVYISQMYGISVDDIFSMGNDSEDDYIDVESLSYKEVVFLNKFISALKEFRK